MDFKSVRAIRTEDDYRQALAAVRPYFEDEPEPDTEEGAHFDALALLIAAYEEKHFPVSPPQPLDALRFRMEQSGRGQSDLAELLGSRSRASEILAGKRALTIDQIRLLHRAWGIPLTSLIGDGPTPARAVRKLRQRVRGDRLAKTRGRGKVRVTG